MIKQPFKLLSDNLNRSNYLSQYKECFPILSSVLLLFSEPFLMFQQFFLELWMHYSRTGCIPAKDRGNTTLLPLCFSCMFLQFSAHGLYQTHVYFLALFPDDYLLCRLFQTGFRLWAESLPCSSDMQTFLLESVFVLSEICSLTATGYRQFPEQSRFHSDLTLYLLIFQSLQLKTS